MLVVSLAHRVAMKSKLLIALALIATLTVGFFAGRFQAMRYFGRNYVKVIMPDIRHATANFSHAAGLLKVIQSGNTNEAIETLEGDLDTNIMLIGAAVEGTPVAERDKQWLSRIRWLREYRAIHPRKTDDPVLDEKVAHTLSIADTNR